MTRFVLGRALLLTLTLCMGVAAAEPRADLQLSFSAARDPRRVSYMDSTSHFHVLLQNRSDHEKRIWEDWNSWGYFNLSFEVIDSSGKKWVVKKRDTGFTRNFPSFLAILPGQTHVFDVYFGDDREWEGFPLRRGAEQTVHIRALYDVSETAESKTNEVWAGHLKSESIQVTFVR
ncbi:MAG TPA: hypothetical protein VKM72_29005 [Thermoanaerobaculia bacterium]|nr:hypothetical protein [Thermoanaerobaculia bacterium]